MNRPSFNYFAPLAVILATLFFLSGCLPDKEKAAAAQRERLQKQIVAANELLHSGQGDRAIEQLSRLEKDNPKNPAVIEALGFAYSQKPDPLMAALYFEHAFELSPTQAELALFAAQANVEVNQYENAADAYRAYLKLIPGDAESWRQLGAIEVRLQRNQPALSAYLEALRLSSNTPTSAEQLTLARLYHNLGNQPQAARWYENVLANKNASTDERADALLGQFDLALRQKSWEQAIALMNELETLAPGTLQSGPYSQAHAELARWDAARKQQADTAAQQTAKTATSAQDSQSTDAAPQGQAATQDKTAAKDKPATATTETASAIQSTAATGATAAAETTATDSEKTAATTASTATTGTAATTDTVATASTTTSTDTAATTTPPATTEATTATAATQPTSTASATAATAAVDQPASTAQATDTTKEAELASASNSSTTATAAATPATTADVAADAAAADAADAQPATTVTETAHSSGTIGSFSKLPAEDENTASAADATTATATIASTNTAATATQANTDPAASSTPTAEVENILPQPADADGELAQKPQQPAPPVIEDAATELSLAQDASAAELAARGTEFFEAGNFEQAAELLERSVKLNPGNAAVLDMLSRASYRINKFPQAERYATLATYAEPQNLAYRLEYLRAYQRNNAPTLLLQQLISAKADFPDSPPVTLALARGYEYIANKKSLAAGIYREYLEQDPKSPLAEEIRQKLLEWEL